MTLRGHSRGNLHASQGGHPNRVNSDQIVLGIVRRGG
jgi:hypothetical protein